MHNTLRLLAYIVRLEACCLAPPLEITPLEEPTLSFVDQPAPILLSILPIDLFPKSPAQAFQHHRDLRDGEVLLGRFGRARMIAERRPRFVRLTLRGRSAPFTTRRAVRNALCSDELRDLPLVGYAALPTPADSAVDSPGGDFTSARFRLSCWSMNAFRSSTGTS